MHDEVIRQVVTILIAHRIRLFYDPRNEPMRIMETLTADDVISIIRDPGEFEAWPRANSRERDRASEGHDRD
jgi:hypothetical protein